MTLIQSGVLQGSRQLSQLAVELGVRIAELHLEQQLKSAARAKLKPNNREQNSPIPEQMMTNIKGSIELAVFAIRRESILIFTVFFGPETSRV